MSEYPIYPIGAKYPRKIGVVIVEADTEMQISHFSPLDQDTILVKAGEYDLIEENTGAGGAHWQRFTVKYHGICVKCWHGNAFCGNLIGTPNTTVDLGKDLPNHTGTYGYAFMDAVRSGHLKIKLDKPYSEYGLPTRATVMTKGEVLAKIQSDITTLLYELGACPSKVGEGLGYKYPDESDGFVIDMARSIMSQLEKSRAIDYVPGPESKYTMSDIVKTSENPNRWR